MISIINISKNRTYLAFSIHNFDLCILYVQVAGSVFIWRSPEVTWKDTSSIFHETKNIQSLPNLSFMPTKTGHCWKPYSFVMVMVWFWLFCTLWARRHNYLHITKLSQTAATRNQQVSVNDKRAVYQKGKEFHNSAQQRLFKHPVPAEYGNWLHCDAAASRAHRTILGL